MPVEHRERPVLCYVGDAHTPGEVREVGGLWMNGELGRAPPAVLPRGLAVVDGSEDAMHVG
jgi:hypothetical protein